MEYWLIWWAESVQWISDISTQGTVTLTEDQIKEIVEKEQQRIDSEEKTMLIDTDRTVCCPTIR